MTLDEFEEWKKVKIFLSQAKSREMELRLKLLESTTIQVGTFKVKLFDTDLKIATTEKLTLDEKLFNSNADDMSEEELNCVNHKPVLDKKRYDKLPDNTVLALKCVTRKQNVSSVAII